MCDTLIVGKQDQRLVLDGNTPLLWVGAWSVIARHRTGFSSWARTPGFSKSSDEKKRGSLCYCEQRESSFNIMAAPLDSLKHIDRLLHWTQCSAGP